jgi:hypothetical protein
VTLLAHKKSQLIKKILQRFSYTAIATPAYGADCCIIYVQFRQKAPVLLAQHDDGTKV